MSTELDAIRWPVRFDHHNLAPGQPGYRFNSSIIDWQGAYLLAYRDGWAGSEVHLVRLDRQFAPMGDSVRLELLHWEEANYGREDPRLFMFRGKLHVCYIGVAGPEEVHHTSVLYARISDDLQVEQIFYPRYKQRNSWEKNWQFFEYAEELYAVYSINPHKILLVDGERCELAYSTPTPIRWDGGEPRGGTSPLRVGTEFHSWFHDSVWENGHKVYRMGHYVFEAKPPFRVLEMTASPLFSADQYTRPHDQYASVIFPCGAVLRDDHWIVSCGCHDRYIELHVFFKPHVDGKRAVLSRPGEDPGYFGPIFTRNGSDKDTIHAYGRAYDALIPLDRRGKVRSVLEVGVHGGGSLRAWRDALPSARVTGWDTADCPGGIPPGATFSRLDGTRMESADSLADGSFDLIVEDASHAPDDQAAAMGWLWPKLSPGGVMVVEDIRPGVDCAALARQARLPASIHRAEIDLRAVKGRWDDRLLVLGPSPLPSALLALDRPPDVEVPRVVYHVAAAYPRWREVVAEQLDLARAAGLSGIWTVTINGSESDEVELLRMAEDRRISMAINDRGDHKNRFESPALRQIQALAKAADGPILYFHTKGVSRTAVDREDWRRLMGAAMIGSWRHRVQDLDFADVVGVDWCPQYRCYPGNFWMVRADAARLLPDYDGHRRDYRRGPKSTAAGRREAGRWAAEQWVGLGETLRYGSVVCRGLDDDSRGFAEECRLGSLWHADIMSRSDSKKKASHAPHSNAIRVV